MDKLDIFEMPIDAKIITTIEELQRLYLNGWNDGRMYETAFQRQDVEWMQEIEDYTTLIRGDIV